MKQRPEGDGKNLRCAAGNGAGLALRALACRRSRPGDLRTGPSQDEKAEITRARAQDLVRRAFETARFMNVAVMNGNDYKGRSALCSNSMPEEEAADTERAIRPVMHPGTVDTKAITILHQQAYAALRAGVAPWFPRMLRNPNEAADFTDYRPTKNACAHVRGGQQLSRTDLAADPHDQACGVRASHRAAQALSTDDRTFAPRNVTAHRHAAIHTGRRQSDQFSPDHLRRQLLSWARGRFPRRLAADLQGDRVARARQSRRAIRQ